MSEFSKSDFDLQDGEDGTENTNDNTIVDGPKENDSKLVVSFIINNIVNNLDIGTKKNSEHKDNFNSNHIAEKDTNDLSINKGTYCYPCPKNFASQQNLNKHFDNKQLVSETKSQILKHKRDNEKEKISRKRRRNETANENDPKETKKKAKTDVEKNELICNFCEKEFAKDSTLTTHIE